MRCPPKTDFPRATAHLPPRSFTVRSERMLTIDHILARYSAKPLSALTPAVRASLRMGVCQLLYMDGVDDYAAVSESVNLVKSLGCVRASGFVNGVLRAFLRDGKAVPPAGGSRAGQLAVDYSCPAWLVEEWLASYGEEAALRMLAGSLGKAARLPARQHPADYAGGALRAARGGGGGSQSRPRRPAAAWRCGAGSAVETLLRLRGGALPRAGPRLPALRARRLARCRGERVLDACAAPGGKTFTIAERMENRGEVVARDLHAKARRSGGKGRDAAWACRSSPPRRGTRGCTTRRSGNSTGCCATCPARGSGSSAASRRSSTSTPGASRALPEIQYKILQTSAQYLRSGGRRLVYSTCTLLPAENERVVERFLRGERGLRPDRAGDPHGGAGGYRRLFHRLPRAAVIGPNILTAGR